MGAARFPSGPQAARLWPVTGLVRDELMRALGPVAQDRPGVARVDDLLDAEPLRRAKRRPDRVEPLLDLRAKSLGVLGGLELAPVGGLDASLDRERAPVAGRPRVTQVEAGVVPVTGAGDAEDLPDEHR